LQKIVENIKIMQIWVYPIICLVIIKINEKRLFALFPLLLGFDSLELSISRGIYAFIVLKHNIGKKLMLFSKG